MDRSEVHHDPWAAGSCSRGAPAGWVSNREHPPAVGTAPARPPPGRVRCGRWGLVAPPWPMVWGSQACSSLARASEEPGHRDQVK